MKITRIEDVYTVPKTEEEWKLFPVRVRSDREICISSNSRCMTVRLGHCSSLGMTEIPVHHFLDLLNDKITPWRLLEVGFFRYESDHMAFDEIGLSFYDIGAEVHYVRNIDPLNINTFTELLQMMKFLGWKNEQVGPQQPAQEVMRRIPVGEKLPPFDEEVFIKNKADGWMKGRLDRIDIAGNRFITPKYDAAGCNTHYDITHWLPLSVLDEYFK